MANWALLFPTGVTFKGIYPSALKQEEDERWPHVPNMKDGSSHAPTAIITVTGLGMSITPLVSTDASLEIVNGKNVTWKTGSMLKTESGSTTTLEGEGEIKSTFTISATGKIQTSGAGAINIESAGIFRAKSGSHFSLDSGAIVGMNLGGASAGALTFLDGNGAATWASASIALWQSGSHFTLSGGSFVNITIGSGGNAGSLNLGSSATFSVLSTCVSSIAIGATGALSTLAGAAVSVSVGGGGTPGSVTFNADGTLTMTSSSVFAQGGATTRTGRTVLSGSGAWTGLRYAFAPSVNSTIDGKAQDILGATAPGPGVLRLTLADVGATDVVSFYIRHISVGVNLEIYIGAFLLYTFTNAGGTKQTVQFFTDGSGVSAWNVGVVGAAI